MAEDITLYELNNMASVAIGSALPDKYRVAAEISELRENSSGHCYMELVQKDEQGRTVAKARANIWAATYRKLRPFFEYSTGMTLKAGIKVLVCVKVAFDPLYHYSLTVWDIDPAYTIGDMAMRRTMILKQLQDEGVIDDNKHLELTPVPQRIAVISSATAAGYGDFCDQLKRNSKGYIFYPVLFKALMQGDQSAESVIEALNRIYNNIDLFDCVVIIRGGGATSELNCFDSYELAVNVAQFPLPVIVGIGHERDITVLDYVANQSVKTPTAVAEFLISRANANYEYLNELSGEITERIKNSLYDNRIRLNAIEMAIPAHISKRVERERMKLSQFGNKIASEVNTKITKAKVNSAILSTSIKNCIERVIEREKSKLSLIENNINLSSPDRILKRGYSIAIKDGRAIKSINEIKNYDNIDIMFADGTASAEIKKR